MELMFVAVSLAGAGILFYVFYRLGLNLKPAAASATPRVAAARAASEAGMTRG
jgi:hypothetical protein